MSYQRKTKDYICKLDLEEHFICYIRNEDINKLDEIKSILEDWLIKNLPSVDGN